SEIDARSGINLRARCFELNNNRESPMTKTIAILAFGAAVVLAGPAFADKMTATLDSKSEVPSNTSTGKGTADIDYDPSSKQLSWKSSYAGRSGPATAAH